jgi:serine/threonine-protein kinase HipA
MKHREHKISVYADWEFMLDAQLMGVLTAQYIRGKEIFSFEYAETWVNSQNPILF